MEHHKAPKSSVVLVRQGSYLNGLISHMRSKQRASKWMNSRLVQCQINAALRPGDGFNSS